MSSVSPAVTLAIRDISPAAVASLSVEPRDRTRNGWDCLASLVTVAIVRSHDATIGFARQRCFPPSLRTNQCGMDNETSRSGANIVKRVASDECQGRLAA
jgi:hypothetical protein